MCVDFRLLEMESWTVHLPIVRITKYTDNIKFVWSWHIIKCAIWMGLFQNVAQLWHLFVYSGRGMVFPSACTSHSLSHIDEQTLEIQSIGHRLSLGYVIKIVYIKYLNNKCYKTKQPIYKLREELEHHSL